MKTIQKGTVVKRADNETADHLVMNGGYQFVPKSTWKVIRDAEKEVVKKDSGRTTPPPIKKNKKK
jgi:hypothetical protein